MINIAGIEGQIERVDELPVLFGLLKQMGIQSIIDEVIEVHGNWQGLSPGWVVLIWLMHVLSEQNHLMEPVQQWVRQHLVLLRSLSKQEVKELDFTDDRLALCLLYLHHHQDWQRIEEQLGARLIRVYDLETGLLRIDATVGTVHHNPAEHTLFQVGKAKNRAVREPVQVDAGQLGSTGSALGGRCEAGQSGRRSAVCAQLPAGKEGA